jgi:hypothetical protein
MMDEWRERERERERRERGREEREGEGEKREGEREKSTLSDRNKRTLIKAPPITDIPPKGA